MVRIPKYPDDFRQLYADGGFAYEHWHPDAPPDFDGTWPANEEPPPWAGGLWVYDDDMSPTRCLKVAVWEFSPETESGPCYTGLGPLTEMTVQDAIVLIMEEVERQGRFAV